MRDCNVITNGREREFADNDVKCIYKEVVVVGNGPSGITLSYLLSGHRPYYNRMPHPDPMLSARLIECTQKSFLHQDLSFLSQGIEGRSKNPISLLIDATSHPGADMGLEWPSLLTWKKTAKCMDHIVLGKGNPGGTWPGIAKDVLTISPGRWMALPGMEFKEYHNERAPANAVAKYYMDYVKKHNLTPYMSSQSTVTMIRPLTSKSRRKARWKVWVNDANGGTISYECRYLVLATGSSDKAGCLGVQGESLPYVTHDLKHFQELLARVDDKNIAPNLASPPLEDGEKLSSPFRRKSQTENTFSDESKLVDSNGDNEPQNLAETAESGLKRETENYLSETANTGETEKRFDKRSETFSEENLDEKKSTSQISNENEYVKHTKDIPGEEETNSYLTEVNRASREEEKEEEEEEKHKEEKKSVLVVGAGLSAADAILAAWKQNYSVIHAFRRQLNTIQLPAAMYSEYYELYRLMQGLETKKDYEPLPEHQVAEFLKENVVVLADSSGKTKNVKVFAVAVLIGSQPDLFFLPQSLKNLGMDPNKPVDCKVNPVQIDPFSYKCLRAPPGLYALGPLVGDNFVRFLQGGAVAIAGHIMKDNSLQKGF